MDDFLRHGGALDAARLHFPGAPEPWLDLSTGINPIPYPVAPLAPEIWSRLPVGADIRNLERVAAKRYGASDALATVAASGAQSIIQRLPALAGGSDVRILERTYDEFGRIFRDAGARIREVPRAGALAGADVAMVVNPNNPDGRFVPVDDLLDVAGRVGTLIVDEAFVDALPLSASLVPHMPAGRAIVLRSFGKIFGLAGLRLGFAIGPRDRMQALRQMLGPWPISGPAIAVATKALGDGDWLADARLRLSADKTRLTRLLERIGARLVGASPLFVLAEHPNAVDLFGALGRSGILTRPFSDEPTWLRFGLPGSEGAWTRLEGALAAFG